jgi:tetratricopeptide (TPR) repeat protein
LILAQQTRGPARPALLVPALLHRAAYYRDRGARELGLRTAGELLRVTQEAYGPRDFRVGGAYGRLAQLETNANRFDDAEADYRRALDIFSETLGPDSSNVATVLANLGNLELRRERFPEAAATYARVLPLFEKFHGVDHPTLVTLLGGLAGAQLELGRLDEAEAAVRRGLRIAAERLPPGHVYLANLRMTAAVIAGKRDRWDEALLEAQATLALSEKNDGPRAPSVADALFFIGRCQLRLGRRAAAVAPLERALALAEELELEPAMEGRIRWELAQALPDVPRARLLATEAQRWLVAGGKTDEATKVAAWIARPRSRIVARP